MWYTKQQNCEMQQIPKKGVLNGMLDGTGKSALKTTAGFATGRNHRQKLKLLSESKKWYFPAPKDLPFFFPFPKSTRDCGGFTT